MPTIYKTNGDIIRNVEPENGTDFQLEECERLLGVGDCMVLVLNNHKLMVMDKHALKANTEMSHNYNATKRYGKCVISGNVLTCNNNQIK